MHVTTRIPKMVDFYNNLNIESFSSTILMLKENLACMMVEGLLTSKVIKEYFDPVHVLQKTRIKIASAYFKPKTNTSKKSQEKL